MCLHVHLCDFLTTTFTSCMVCSPAHLCPSLASVVCFLHYTYSVCAVCGHVLERNVLSTEGHLRLLEQVEQHLRRSVDAFEDNRKEREEVLAFRRMISSEPPPLAVLDGLNVAYQRRRDWRQVGPGTSS